MKNQVLTDKEETELPTDLQNDDEKVWSDKKWKNIYLGVFLSLVFMLCLLAWITITY
ncbi:hypothetical protein [Aureibacter tunicatorum]|uniref:Uncharacterized protein n=1 Tax=Aureibacter tunicatorum TaxID=866807 RepID=A0AAE3XMZ7_9BACT|nr:hypothetical protein [Aureibacter tunicatorum]MDR6238741.1 hypothetical protein [Aureibacter tunicatorum]BDD05328.1 hypothetical protein AUTU_28110 [Aureibacter tunicatorum]